MPNCYFKEPDYYDVFPLRQYEFEDLRVPPAMTVKDLSKGPNYVDYKGGYVMDFSAGSDKFVKFNIQLPHGYKVGSELRPHVHWAAPDANSGVVRWQLSYSWANIHSAFPTPTPITLDADTPEEADVHNVSNFSALSGTGKVVSSMLICELGRLGTEDTYASSAYLLEFDVHVKLVTVGTQIEYPSHT